MKIQTVNQLISVFKDISTRHYQINGFGIGDNWENGASEAKMHPVLWINPTTATMPSTDTGYKTFEIDFEVRVFDLVNKDESNENEVLSDCIDILKDIITEFKGHPYYVNSQLNIIDDISFEAFTEEFDEEVSGWVCEISLMTPILTSFCGIPSADITGFEFPGINCPDVNVLCPVFVEDVTGVYPIVVNTIGTTKEISIDGSVTDTFVISGEYDNGTLTLTRNDSVDVVVTGFENDYTTAATLSGNIITFDRTDTAAAYSVDLTTAINSAPDKFVQSGAYDEPNEKIVLTLNDASTVDIDTSAISGGGGGGLLGISDNTGKYTYYATIELALSAATSGDVIEQFTNISVIGTTTINLVDGVTWQMNGYEYKNTDAGQVRMFTLPSNSKVKIFNGKITRNGGGAGNSNTTLYNNQSGSTLIATGTTFKSVNSSSIFASCTVIDGLYISENSTYNMVNINGTHINVRAEGQGQNYLNGANARIYNSYYSSTGNDNYISSGAIAYNSVFISSASYGGYFSGHSNEAYNCSFKSTANTGVVLIGSSSTAFNRLFNCTVKSTGGKGIDMFGSTEVYNCIFNSSVNIGLNIRSNAKAYNSTSISLASKAISGTSNFTLIDCTAKSFFDNSTGHAIEAYTTNTSFTIAGGYAETVNSSANGLNISANTNGRWAGIKFKGMSTAVVFTNANQMVNTPDAFGNILIG